MGDRDDHFQNQQGDGYAAYIGGVAAQCTHAMNEWWGLEGVGTMPHALIQIFNGDIVAASKAYMEVYPKDNITALVDFNNDVITDSLLIANELKGKLHSVRVDTSQALIDKYFDRFDYQAAGIDPHGVNPTLITALRKALDEAGHCQVKIVVSSGFNVDKINQFKAEKAPVDVYGIGSSLIKITMPFTGDLVRLNGKPLAKVGRKERFSDRLVEVKYQG
jgi:nicotinate phosphoribosyltransferase